MPGDLSKGIVRILDSDGNTAGTGFVVTDDGLIATCAHVVEAAGARPGDIVHIASCDHNEAEAEVLPDAYHSEFDVAFLRRSGPLPEECTPVTLAQSEGLEDVPVRAFGYPAVGEVEGLWGTGELVGPVTEAGQPILQLRSTQITEGFSGSPVWERGSGCVMGMIASVTIPDRLARLSDVAFAIPAETLRDLCPESLALHPLEPPVSSPLLSQADVRGSGAIAQGARAVAAGANGIAVGRDLHIHVSTPLHTTPEPPFMADALPADFVQRPEEFDPLVEILLAEGERPVAITTALRGAGGYGKTILATALCHDEHVRAAFPDGILWVTLGQEPKLLGDVVKLLRALTGERLALVDVEDAAQELTRALGDRRCLLVIDDVWNQAHTRPFLRGGPHSTRLITTRNRDTLPSGAHTVDVDAMQPGEAVQLLGTGLDVGQDGVRPRLTRLAARLGEWPLLLGLVNSALQRRVDQGQSLASALAWVEGALEKRGLTAFDAQNAEARNQAVSLTLEVSLELLSEEEQARYRELAVFPEDEEVPLKAVARLWGATGSLDNFDAEVLCGQLFDLSLLRRFDLAARTIQLHDVMRDYLVQRQGERLPALHDRLLEAYAAACQHGTDGTVCWHTGPDDGYYFQHLLAHLHQAGCAEDVWTLLLDFRWLWARLHATGVSALLVDYEVGLAAFEATHRRRVLRWIQGALRLSAHVLARDPAQLPGQVLGRLMAIQDDDIHGLTEQVENYAETPWLRPLTPSLTPPGSPLLRTLTGHRGSVMAVAVTSDGRQRAVSGSSDGTLRVWDVESGEELRTLTGHSGAVMAVAVTPNGSRAVSASEDQTLKVWDVESGEELRTLTGHSARVNAVAVTPDGSRAVSASSDGTLKVWDVGSGEELRTLTGLGLLVNAVAVTPDGRRAVSASFDETLRVWDLEGGEAGGEAARTLTGHAAWVKAVAVTPDGRRAVSASYDQTLKVWDISTLLDTGLENGEVISEAARTLTGHTDWVNAVAVTPDGRRAVSASCDQTLKVWDISTLLDTGLESGEVVSEAARTLMGHSGSVVAVAVTPDGQRAVSASDDQTLKVWDLESGKVVHTLRGHTDQVDAVTVTPDGQRAVSASDDHTLKVWDLELGKELAALTGHSDKATAVALTSDGQRAVSASRDKTLKVWDVKSGEELGTLTGHKDWVIAVAVTPDGRRAVSASKDGMLKVWNCKPWEDVSEAERTLTGHTHWVRAIAVTPDGRRAVSASDDQTLKVWDLERGKLIATFSADGALYTCAIVPDVGAPWDSVIVTGGASGRVHFLRLEGDESLRR